MVKPVNSKKIKSEAVIEGKGDKNEDEVFLPMDINDDHFEDQSVKKKDSEMDVDMEVMMVEEEKKGSEDEANAVYTTENSNKRGEIHSSHINVAALKKEGTSFER